MKYFIITILIGITGFTIWNQSKPEIVPLVFQIPAPIVQEEVKPKEEPKLIKKVEPKPVVIKKEVQAKPQGSVTLETPKPTPEPVQQPPQQTIIIYKQEPPKEPEPIKQMEPTSQKNITFHTEKIGDGDDAKYNYYAVVFNDEGKSIMSDVYFHANVDYKCKCGSKIPANNGKSVGDEIRYEVTGSSYPGENMGVEATAIDMVKSFPFAK